MTQRESLPSALSMQDVSIPFTTIRDQFAQSDYGKQLDANIRFKWFKAESMSNPDWESLLGPDVNNLRHLHRSYRIARRFVSHNHNPDFVAKGVVSPAAIYTPAEKELFLFTSIVHDWGEAKTGDIQYGTKTEVDEEDEYQALRQAINEIVPTTDDDAKRELGDAVVSVLSDTNSKLGGGFHTMERIGYVGTGLIGWDRSKEIKDEEVKHGLQLLTLNVTGRHVSYLIDHADIYPAVNSFLIAGERRFEEIYESLGDLKSLGHAQDSLRKREDFMRSRQDWQNFIKK